MHNQDVLRPNPGKPLHMTVADARWARLPIRTHVIGPTDHLEEVVRAYALPSLRPRDILYISERIVAITQGRAYPITEIAPSRLAKFLVRFVHKSPYGIGLGSPWTMELALKEAGRTRILLAAFGAALTKPFGVRGVFYRIAGRHTNAIDGPCAYTLPPYDRYAKLGPADPSRVARNLKERMGNETVIIDANDLGVAVLGKSSEAIDDAFSCAVFRDNPLGQSREQTPLCIVRRVDA